METITHNVHHGRNIRRLREILNIKQDTIIEGGVINRLIVIFSGLPHYRS